MSLGGGEAPARAAIQGLRRGSDGASPSQREPDGGIV